MSVLEIGDVSIEAGEIVALLGGNGAGKTTLLETVLGFHPGRVVLFGRDVSALTVEQRVQSGVGYVPEGRRVFAALTVRENLEASSSLPAAQRRQRVDEMLALFPMLGERPEARAWLLSGGQQQMLALARALMDRPRLLLLDEPTAGMSPQETGETIASVRDIVKARGLTLLFTEHDMSVVFGIAERISVLHHGEIIASGTPDTVRNDPEVKRVYLGEHAHG